MGRLPIRYICRASILLAFVALASAPSVAQTFAANGISITISADGKVSQLVDLGTGVNRCTTAVVYQTYLVQLQAGGVLYNPTGFSRAGNQLTYTFNQLSPARTVVVEFSTYPEFLILRLVSVSSSAGLDFVRFADLRPMGSIDGQIYRLLRFDDSGVGRYWGIYSLDPFTHIEVGPAGSGSYLWAMAEPNLPYPTGSAMSGQRVAFFTSSTDDAAVRSKFSAIETTFGIPIGMAGRAHPAVKRSCFFWQGLTYARREEALQYMQQAAIGRMLLLQNVWGDLRQSYQVNSEWGSAANLAAWVNQCKAAGISTGAHLFVSMVPKDSYQFVLPGAHAGLRRDRSVVLAASVPSTQTDGLILTSSPPVGWPTDSWNREIVIDQEIIRYTGLKTDGPYGFVGPFERAFHQTGAGGSGPRNHNAGATAQHLVSTVDDWGYQLELNSSAIPQLSTAAAQTLNQVGFDFIYADGLEESQEPHWFVEGALLQQCYDPLNPKPKWMEASANTGRFSFPFITCSGQTDIYPLYNPYKTEVDRNIVGLLDVSHNFNQRQLGWYQLSYGITKMKPDDIEYLMAKSIAHNVPVVFQAWVDQFDSWPLKDANLALIATYETLRVGSYFPQSARDAAKLSTKDFMLFTARDSTLHLAPVTFLPVGQFSSKVRAYFSDRVIDGARYVTLWPTALNGHVSVTLHGISAANLSIVDWNGTAVRAVDLPGAQVFIPVNTRLYIRVTDVPDIEDVFVRATVAQ